MTTLQYLGVLLQLLAFYSMALSQILPPEVPPGPGPVDAEAGPSGPGSAEAGFLDPENGTADPELSVAEPEEGLVVLNDSSQDTHVMVVAHAESISPEKEPPLLCSESPTPTLVRHDSPVELRASLSDLPEPCFWSFKVDENSTSPNTSGMSEMHGRILASGSGKYLVDVPENFLRLSCEDLILLGENEWNNEGDEGGNSGSAGVGSNDCPRGNYLIVGDTLERSERVCGLVQDYSFTSGTGALTVRLRAQEAGSGMGDFEMAGCIVTLE